jgi:hypothetical protein
MKKIVLHFLDGEILKGTTWNFSADRPWFYLIKSTTGEKTRVDSSQLKAIFFVKTFEGNPLLRKNYDLSLPGLGTKVSICFKDGETTFGYTYGLNQERNGFFLFPSDRYSNNEKVFVLTAATQEIRFQ